MSQFGFWQIIGFCSFGGLIITLILFTLGRHVKQQFRNLEQSKMALSRRIEGSYTQKPLCIAFRRKTDI